MEGQGERNFRVHSHIMEGGHRRRRTVVKMEEMYEGLKKAHPFQRWKGLLGKGFLSPGECIEKA